MIHLNKKMKVITCNMMYDYDHDGSRTTSQLSIIKNINPDIIMFQEIFNRRKTQIESDLSECGYKMFNEFYVPGDEMWCQIFIKDGITVNDVLYTRYTSGYMQRGFCSINVNNVWYVTTHLESLNTPQYEKIRLSQLDQLWEFLKDKDFVLGMDSNIEGDIVCPIDNVQDVWEDDPIHTWFAERFFSNNASARYDRFYVRNQIVQSREIIENRFSDHNILCVDVSSR